MPCVYLDYEHHASFLKERSLAKHAKHASIDTRYIYSCAIFTQACRALLCNIEVQAYELQIFLTMLTSHNYCHTYVWQIFPHLTSMANNVSAKVCTFFFSEFRCMASKACQALAIIILLHAYEFQIIVHAYIYCRCMAQPIIASRALLWNIRVACDS